MAVGRAKTTRAVGRYHLVHELGQSYLGPLWAVRVEGADGSAQLAMLRLVSLARLDADTRVRLLEAAWQAMEVRDDRVCPVTDVVASDGELGIVSDYVEGVTFRGLASFASVRRKPAPPAVAVRVALELLAAVTALHRATAELGDEAVPLYGGLSADSVLLAADGRTLVLDVAVTSAASTIETLGGNPERAAYAAPEQLRSPPSADARTDLFTVGVLLWELLACRRLFVGSDKAVAQKVLTSKIPRPDELRRKGDPDMPSALVATVMKALERDPSARPESAEVFAELLANAGVVPAEREEVALYVTTLAEGALQRARDAVRNPASGTRSALPRTTGKPAAPAPQEAHAAVPPAKPPLPARAEPKPALPARPDVKPPLPTRTDVKPALAPRAPVTSARLDAKSGGMRARQPTMIGIPGPSVQIAPRVPEPPPEPTLEPSIAALLADVAALSPESDVGRTPLTLEPSMRVSIPIADASDEEPTAQFTSRDLLRQVEAMGRRSEPSRNAAPTEFPKVEAAAAPSTEIPKGGEAIPRLSDLVNLEAPSDGGWLDDPASLPPPAMSPAIVDREATTPDDPTDVAERQADRKSPSAADLRFPVARVPDFAPTPTPPVSPTRLPETAPAPETSASRARDRPLLSKAPPSQSLAPAAGTFSVAPPPTTSLSVAPAAYLPSQVPPPLIHDPRARGAAARRAPSPPHAEAGPAPRVPRGMAVGIALSLALVITSAAVAIVVLRGQRDDAERGASPTADRPLATPSPAVPAASEMQPETARTSEPEPSASVAPATAPTAITPEPAEPGASATATDTATAGSFPGAHPGKPFAARPAPPPAKRPAPAKKKGRYVPDDI